MTARPGPPHVPVPGKTDMANLMRQQLAQILAPSGAQSKDCSFVVSAFRSFGTHLPGKCKAGAKVCRNFMASKKTCQVNVHFSLSKKPIVSGVFGLIFYLYICMCNPALPGEAGTPQPQTQAPPQYQLPAAVGRLYLDDTAKWTEPAKKNPIEESNRYSHNTFCPVASIMMFKFNCFFDKFFKNSPLATQTESVQHL